MEAIQQIETLMQGLAWRIRDPVAIAQMDGIKALSTEIDDLFLENERRITPDLKRRFYRAKGLYQRMLDTIDKIKGKVKLKCFSLGVEGGSPPNTLEDWVKNGAGSIKARRKVQKIMVDFLKDPEAIELNFSGLGVKDMPEVFGDLPCRERLFKINFSYCKALEHAPKSLEYSLSLKEITFFGCRKLKSIPCLWKCEELEKIEVSFCRSLDLSEQEFWRYQALKVLDCYGCAALWLNMDQFIENSKDLLPTCSVYLDGILCPRDIGQKLHLMMNRDNYTGPRFVTFRVENYFLQFLLGVLFKWQKARIDFVDNQLRVWVGERVFSWEI